MSDVLVDHHRNEQQREIQQRELVDLPRDLIPLRRRANAEDADEQCDAGSNGVKQDSPTCNSDCTFARCGDGFLNPAAGEACDDGPDNGTAASVHHCNQFCQFNSCGNGILESNEQCDDGNSINGDGCEADCTLPRCGNSILDLGEQCDDGNLINGDTCEADCTLPRCGNGILDLDEECDDGSANGKDGLCAADCRLQ